MAESGDFKQWLETTGQQFASLSDTQRNETLDHFIDLSDAAQLYHLSAKLDRLLKRDFIVQLPREITFYLLTFLNAEALAVCCAVSTRWDHIVSSCREAWKRACRRVGAFVRDDMEAEQYKELCTRTHKRVASLRGPRAFDTLLLHGHTDRVMAMYYRDGKLATGTQ